jgi:hypothetical protein
MERVEVRKSKRKFPLKMYSRPSRLSLRLVLIVVLFVSYASNARSQGFQGVLTYHNDDARTGQNLLETALTPSNVNSSTFGKLFSYPVDGYIYAQSLYVPSVTLPHKGGVHNVVYVATEHDSVYAFDADGTSASPLWHTSFLNAKKGITTVSSSLVGTDEINPEIGITGTPVIDPSSGTLYVVAKTINRAGVVQQHLHALSITTGKEKFGGPKLITASVKGTGDAVNKHGMIAFDPLLANQRSALLLANGIVYVAFASHGDQGPYHGWLFAYKAHGLGGVAVYNSTPNGSKGGIWQGANAPAVDANGNLYFGISNGTFDVNTGGSDYGDSFVRAVLSKHVISIADYFTPFDQSFLASGDLDLGSSGALLLPDQSTGPAHLAVTADKNGTIYLLNRDSLGHFNAADDSQIVQELFEVSGMMICPFAYFNNSVYFVAVNQALTRIPLVAGQFDTGAINVASTTINFPGASPSISANGSADGIAWVIKDDNYNAGPSILFAYDASDLSELYDSSQAPDGRDTAGFAVKFTTPTIANGKVYIDTQTELDTYGLLP